VGKVVLYIFLCALVTLVCVAFMAIIGNQGWGGIAIQQEMTPTIWWSAPAVGASAGVILAIANLLGRMPRLRWRSLLAFYSAFPGLFVFLIAIVKLVVQPYFLNKPGYVSFGYTYFAPDSNFGVSFLGVILAMAAAVMLRRWRLGARAAEPAPGSST